MQDPENCINVLPGDQPADNTANLKWVGGGCQSSKDKAAKTWYITNNARGNGG